MKPDLPTASSFDRPKLFLFKFLAHQIHPFAYAVNTFLQPALDDCRTLLITHPKDALNVLLSLAQTFIRFAPDAELIYDDIQQFARKLNDTLEECCDWLDASSNRESAQLFQTARESLLAVVERKNATNSAYAEMYKNFSEKINSLPVEMQNILFDEALDKTIPVEISTKQEPIAKTNGHSERIPLPTSFSYSTHGEQIATATVASTTSSVTTKLMNQMKNLSVASMAPSNQSVAAVSGSIEKQKIETIMNKKSNTMIAAFPPRINPSSLSSIPTNDQLEIMSDYERELQTPTPSNDGGIRFGTTPAPYGASATSSNYDDDDWDDEKSRQYYLNPCFTDPAVAGAFWQPARDQLSVVMEQSHINRSTSGSRPHITDEYLQEFGNKQTRPALRGDLWMTYGTPQNGSQSTCLPIGIGLTYDESTLLSCDVHRNSQNIRLFDIQSGRLKHTICSNQQMKFHRPSAVMSNTRNNILIVERDYIYVTESDGRLVQTIGHRSVKQLYGIATFNDRYLLTIDSKASDAHAAENSRLLLFDPNSGQLVYEQRLDINRESEGRLKQQWGNCIKGKILPETSSKPRFLTVHNDKIYIADLGRSLIYGIGIRNQSEFDCTTVFGGQGRGNGEMTDPSGLFVDSGGNIISADSKNDRIQIFSSAGDYKTILKLNERIKRPSGICTNRAGTQLYVSCYLAGCVRAFNIGY